MFHLLKWKCITIFISNCWQLTRLLRNISFALQWEHVKYTFPLLSNYRTRNMLQKTAENKNYEVEANGDDPNLSVFKKIYFCHINNTRRTHYIAQCFVDKNYSRWQTFHILAAVIYDLFNKSRIIWKVLYYGIFAIYNVIYVIYIDVIVWC